MNGIRKCSVCHGEISEESPQVGNDSHRLPLLQETHSQSVSQSVSHIYMAHLVCCTKVSCNLNAWYAGWVYMMCKNS